MSRSDVLSRLLYSRDTRRYSRDTRRLLFLALFAAIAACTRAFSIQSDHSSRSSSQSLVSIRQQHYPSSTALFMAPKTNAPDEAEWKALLAAFQMYKAAYGDLKVPSRFIVPGMPPWPGKGNISADSVQTIICFTHSHLTYSYYF